jgi:hypothetical protein
VTLRRTLPLLCLQDSTELPYLDLGDALQEAKDKGRFREALVVLDTCQAASAADAIVVPGVAVVGSSRVGENSYSTDVDMQVRARIPVRAVLCCFISVEYRKYVMVVARARCVCVCVCVCVCACAYICLRTFVCLYVYACFYCAAWALIE